MDEKIEPINLAPIYCVNDFKKKKKYEQNQLSIENFNSLIISILTKYVGDRLINLTDSKFIAMETEISTVLKSFKKQIEEGASKNGK